MKKNILLTVGILLMLTSCGNEKQSIDADIQSSAAAPAEVQEAFENEDLIDGNITDLWQQTEGKDERNVLEFVTGLQVILPKEWEERIVIHTEPAVQSYGGRIVVCEKQNAEADAGGMLFSLEYIKYDEHAIAPYEIFQDDRVLGVYQKGEDMYALVFTLPRDRNYVKENEEMQKAYEEVNAFTNKVQILTEAMENFTECGLNDLDWIVLSGAEQPENLEMVSYHNPGIELKYPAGWEVKEKAGEDGGGIRFYDEKGEDVFWIEQGEAWRVDLNMDEEGYKSLLSELYQEVEIIELSNTLVNGYDAQKLKFAYTVDGENKMITRYIVVAGYAFFELNYMYSADRMSEDNIEADIIESIVFVNAGS